MAIAPMTMANPLQLPQREKRELGDQVAICRVEQLHPFPHDLVLRELRRYPNAEVMWCQEEPKNMGAYLYVVPRMETCMRALGRAVDAPLAYSGRPTSASTATGFASVHAQEQSNLIDGALSVE